MDRQLRDTRTNLITPTTPRKLFSKVEYETTATTVNLGQI